MIEGLWRGSVELSLTSNNRILRESPVAGADRPDNSLASEDRRSSCRENAFEKLFAVDRADEIVEMVTAPLLRQFTEPRLVRCKVAAQETRLREESLDTM